ncbi:hypothetical protein ACFVWT_10385 [Arthrobacter sp. NPDC058288]|uniref:hypothetical protein n=1 Tax=Arthrobacter sp. NPDC058288 TaxID=3346424 RepID=UPI0036E641BE
MRNLILVAFIEPVSDGLVFPRDDWPLHITLVRFDVDLQSGDADTSVDAGNDDGGGQSAGLADRIAGLIDKPVRAALGSGLTIGEDAGFGRQGSVPVGLVQPSRPLQELHESLVGTVMELPGRVPTPQHILDKYRPHVSHHGPKRPQPGDAVVLDRVALVDMAPDGNHSVRRILHLWELTK